MAKPKQLKSKLMYRRQAETARQTARHAVAAGRAGQVSRSSIQVGDDSALLDDVLAGAVGTGIEVEVIVGDVDILDDGAADDVPVLSEAGSGVDVDDLLDVSDTDPDLGDEMDADADADDAAHRAGMAAAEAAEIIEDTRIEIDGKLTEAAENLAAADERIAEAKKRADDAFGKAETGVAVSGEMLQNSAFKEGMAFWDGSGGFASPEYGFVAGMTPDLSYKAETITRRQWGLPFVAPGDSVEVTAKGGAVGSGALKVQIRDGAMGPVVAEDTISGLTGSVTLRWKNDRPTQIAATVFLVATMNGVDQAAFLDAVSMKNVTSLAKTETKVDEAKRAADAAVTSQVDEYAVSSAPMTEPSGGWSTTPPAYVAGQWVWRRTVTTHGDGTTSTSLPVLSTGPEGAAGSAGASAISVTVGNEAVTIPATSAGATLAASTITVPFAGWVGNARSAATVAVSGLPTGITVSSNTAATTSADGSLVLAVASGSTLGGAASGTITLSITTSSRTFPVLLSWAKALGGATGAPGADGATGATGATGAPGTSVSTLTLFYYISATQPALPTASPPPAPWTTTQPTPAAGETRNLYVTVRTLLSTGAWSYGPISMDASFSAAKTAYDRASSALTMAGTKSRVLYSTVAPSGTASVDDLWRRQATAAEITAGATAGDIMQEWRYTGSGWQETRISTTAIANLDVGKLTVKSGVISDLVAQHIAARSGTYIQLDVSQLNVTGTASIRQAVIDKLWADVVKAKLLTVTEKIIANDIFAAGVVSASALAATAIDGKIITGATMRTAASGQRMQFDGNGLRAFDTSGTVTAELKANGGNMSLFGKLIFEDFFTESGNGPGDFSAVGVQLNRSYGRNLMALFGNDSPGGSVTALYAGPKPGVYNARPAGSSNVTVYQSRIELNADTVDYSTDTPWVNLGVTGWTHRVTPQARVRAGRVQFRGLISNDGFSGPFTACGTLPASIPRPPIHYRSASVGLSGIEAIFRVGTTGGMEMLREAATAAWCDLSRLSYEID